jgi:hypothetical protein
MEGREDKMAVGSSKKPPGKQSGRAGRLETRRERKKAAGILKRRPGREKMRRGAPSREDL